MAQDYGKAELLLRYTVESKEINVAQEADHAVSTGQDR